GWDLANVPGKVVGTAKVSATVRYPFEPVTARPVTSNVITKTVTSAFSKTITCYPKGSQPVEQQAAICVAEAHDITGAPFVGETVCFLADFNAEDIQWFTGTIPGTSDPNLKPPGGPIVIGKTSRNTTAEGSALRRICPRTDSAGRAAVEVFNSNPTTVNVTAVFVDEGILRSIHVQFPITGPQGPSNGVRNSTQTSTGGAPTSGDPTGGGSTGDNASSYDASDYHIASARLMRPKAKKPYLRLRGNGPTATVHIRLTLLTSRGKLVSKFVSAVETNKVVQIRGFKIAKTVRTIRVGVAA